MERGTEIRASTVQALPFWKRKTFQTYLGQTLVFLIAFLGGIAFFVPFFWAVSSSVKLDSQLFVDPPIWIPNTIQLQNYPEALSAIPFARYYLNTAIITGTSMIGDVVVSTLVAYGFARMRFVGRDTLFMVLLATMMLPMQVTMIPQFIIYRSLGWINTFLPLIVPSFFGSAFYIFLLRQFFLGIPLDLEDAARIDGASSLHVLWYVFVPLSLTAMATVAIFSFMQHWQDFFLPLIYLNSNDMKTVSLGLQMFRSDFSTDWNHMMAASVMATIPPLLLFFFAQRFFISGIVMTGLKE